MYSKKKPGDEHDHSDRVLCNRDHEHGTRRSERQKQASEKLDQSHVTICDSLSIIEQKMTGGALLIGQKNKVNTSKFNPFPFLDFFLFRCKAENTENLDFELVWPQSTLVVVQLTQL